LPLEPAPFHHSRKQRSRQRNAVLMEGGYCSQGLMGFRTLRLQTLQDITNDLIRGAATPPEAYEQGK